MTTHVIFLRNCGDDVLNHVCTHQFVNVNLKMLCAREMYHESTHTPTITTSSDSARLYYYFEVEVISELKLPQSSHLSLLLVLSYQIHCHERLMVFFCVVPEKFSKFLKHH
ncbi:CLUMA_CG012240, isoform A [Clunio marinus]|uniref:CLUMA_CG012240, isoform A n=1 Tax=Clunio marinus TaxID=568069 RepID=A0A1J1IKB0_9DIPT|nr:CLUMA_CG012240, isoform A [Clunio marinus]